MDKTTVAVIHINSYSEDVVFGHVPKNMSKTVFMFLSLPHRALDISVTGKHINRGGGHGLEIPANSFLMALTWKGHKIAQKKKKKK